MFLKFMSGFVYLIPFLLVSPIIYLIISYMERKEEEYRKTIDYYFTKTTLQNNNYVV